MSVATRDAPEAAVAAHIDDEGDPGVVISWVTVAARATLDGDSTGYTVIAHGPWHSTSGLLRYATLYTDDDATRVWEGSDDD